MQVSITIHDPSAHWLALAKIIERAEEFPAPWLLVIYDTRVQIRDRGTRGEPLICEADFGVGQVSTLEGKMRFLDWMYECAKKYGGAPPR